MADITTFPTITAVVSQGHHNARDVIAGAAIKAGQVVAYARTGVSNTVHPAVKGTTGGIAGVAAYDIASGAKGTIYTNGAIVYVANADDTTAIGAGSLVEHNDNAVGGTVSALVAAATTADGEALYNDVLGYALDDIAGGATGRVMIQMQTSRQNQG
jgi:hypothetical protein